MGVPWQLTALRGPNNGAESQVKQTILANATSEDVTDYNRRERAVLLVSSSVAQPDAGIVPDKLRAAMTFRWRSDLSGCYIMSLIAHLSFSPITTIHR